LDILDHYPEYVDLASEIRHHLLKNHSYEVRLTELLEGYA
jgi:hypothetical protein